MKLRLYSLKNRLSGLYERPVAEIFEKEQYMEYLCQSLALAPIEQLARYKEFDVYCLGLLDTASGEIVPGVDFVGTLEALCGAYINAKKEDVKDGNGKEQTTGA